jgi:hypothetical protein
MKIVIIAAVICGALGGFGGYSLMKSLENKEDKEFRENFEALKEGFSVVPDEAYVPTSEEVYPDRVVEKSIQRNSRDLDIRYQSNYDLAWGPSNQVVVVSKVKELVVNDIVVNEGNCEMWSPTPEKPFGGGSSKTGFFKSIDFPITLKFGEHIDARFDSECQIIKVEVETPTTEYVLER